MFSAADHDFEQKREKATFFLNGLKDPFSYELSGAFLTVLSLPRKRTSNLLVYFLSFFSTAKHLLLICHFLSISCSSFHTNVLLVGDF